MASYTFTLPRAIESQNKTQWAHWTKSLKIKNAWRELVSYTVKGKIPASRGGKRKLSIYRYGPRELDVTNIVGGAKFLIDALVDWHILFDDSPKYFALGEIANVRWLKKDGKPHTVIVIEDVDDQGTTVGKHEHKLP